MVRLGDICEVVFGTTPKSNIPEYWDGELNWVTPAELDEDSYVIYESHRKITEQAVKDSGLKSFPAGTVLLSSRAPIGKVAIAGVDMYCNQGFKNLICSEKIHNKYLFWFLKSKIEYLNSLGRGATFKEISKGIVENIEVPLPSIEHQRQYATVLDKLSDLISLRKQQLTKLDKLVKARFMEMFGDPIANQKKWPVKRLVDIAELITNGTTPKGGSENYIDSGILFLRSQNIWRNRIELDDVAYIDQETHVAMKKSSVHYKDILITKTGRINTENSSLGRAALFLGENDSANINGHVYLVRLNEQVVPEFVVTILTGEAYRKYIRKVCVGGIDKRQINLEQVEEFPIILPPIAMQKQFAIIINEVCRQKLTIQQSLDKLEVLKNSLMQEYFGGEGEHAKL